MPASTGRIDLNVPFTEKDNAKALGAKWDAVRRTWFAPPGADLNAFSRWLPPQRLEVREPTPAYETQPATEPPLAPQGCSLSSFLNRIAQAIALAVPNAEWVRAEISELHTKKNGHVFLELAEHSESGVLLSRVSARIWAGATDFIQAKFQGATGAPLSANIKVLLLIRASFHPQYGLTLSIEDIDPAYTLGDMAAKIQRIRQVLVAEGILARNKALPKPVEFTHIAVITPEKAAGLGDFAQEANWLEKHGLCRFRYYQAVFQGPDAEPTLLRAIAQALQDHEDRPCDALVVLRGGGAVTDLAWLNNENVARALCLCPIPVFTGIGHERDNTILDEVALQRFDTPSKVAAHIAATIIQNAQTAVTNIATIQQVATAHCQQRAEDATTLLNTILREGQHSVVSAKQQTHHRMEVIAQQATQGLRVAERDTERNFTLAMDRGQTIVENTTQTLEQQMNFIAIVALRTHGEAQRAAIALRQDTLQNALRLCDQAAGDVVALTELVRDRANRFYDAAAKTVTSSYDDIAQDSRRLQSLAAQQVQSTITEILAIGPQGTLRRGYAIARRSDGQVLHSAEQARRESEFVVEFVDGRLRVQPLGNS